MSLCVGVHARLKVWKFPKVEATRRETERRLSAWKMILHPGDARGCPSVDTVFWFLLSISVKMYYTVSILKGRCLEK